MNTETDVAPHNDPVLNGGVPTPGSGGNGSLTTPGAGGSPVGTGGAASGGTGAVVSTGGTSTGGASTGGTSTGGASGGGSSVGTPAEPYDYGVSPTTITVEDARASYDAWKNIHLENCGSGRYRVRWENAKLDATVSEGIGYGMLLAVSWGEQEIFDGLYDYYQAALNEDTGLMHWLRYGCDASWDTKYSEYPDGAASDADVDVAMALIMADCKWGGGGYAGEATGIIGNIREHMFMEFQGQQVLQPGDSSWFDDLGNGCVNYSYFAPAYYREFARFDGGNAAFWNAAASDTYSLLAAASNGSTGLLRNWGSSDGGDATAECHNSFNRAASYGDDAARTPWRIVTDYLWNGTAAAKSWNDRVTTWVNTVGITNTAQWYELGGAPDTQASTWDDHTAINVGPWATGAMSLDQASVDAFAAELVAIPSGPADHDGEYFPRMLKALSLLTLAGGFTTCGGQ